MAKAKAEEEASAASEKAQKAAEAAKKLEGEVKRLSEQEAEAATLAKEVKAKAEAAAKALGLSPAGGFSWGTLTSQLATAVSQKNDAEPKTQIATFRGQAKARSLLPQMAVLKRTAASRPKPKEAEPKPKPKQEAKPEVRNIFGGLFKQETIYVDDD